MCCTLSVTGAANREHYALHSGPVHAKRNSTRPTLAGWKWLRWVTDATASTLMEAPAKRLSCLMCCPFFPMMAPTACAGMYTWTVSCSGVWTHKHQEQTHTFTPQTQQLVSDAFNRFQRSEMGFFSHRSHLVRVTFFFPQSGKNHQTQTRKSPTPKQP